MTKHMQRLPHWLCGLIFLFIWVACTPNSDHGISLDENGNESFVEFRDVFYNDSLFQLQRTEFPLSGTDPNGEDDNFYWEMDNWRILRLDANDPQIKLMPLLSLNQVMIERIVLQDRFLIESKFSLIDGKWYLTEYSGVKMR